MEHAIRVGHPWPSPPRWPLVGHVPALMSRGFIEFLRDSWRRYGDCFELRIANHSIKIIVHPDDVEAMLLTRRDRYCKGQAYDQFRRLVGDGLVTAEGELWRRERRLIQPCFRRETIAGFGERMVAQTDAMLDRWTSRWTSEEFDVHAELMRLTLEIIGDCLFDLEFGDDRASLSTQAFTEAMEVIANRVTAVAVPPRWLPTPGNRRLDRSIAELDRVVAGVIASRRRLGVDHDDLLGALLRARDEHGQPLDEVQLRDEVLTMFLAGHETTAVALTWALYLLDEHDEVRARCAAEVDAVLGDRRPSVADLPQLAYLGQVFHECMRVIPPVWSGARNCVAPDTLGAGFPVEPGDRIINVICLTHMHPEFWPDPERFDPERFAPEAVAARHKFAYMPFSEGPRKCVGLHFATMEAQLLLARMLQRGELRVAAGFEPEFDYHLTTRPKHGLRVRWTPRG
ncbi:MAG: cytochrome P450 [Enhygromyxa sp.]